ncbi:MAG: ERF family protein [Clostridiales bacterium]|nr:ERF family protein [Clostridiales bacterium]
MAQIHELIGKAMGEIGAIGKDSKNQQQGFMYRGIDAVYNALNPVMAKYGLFICPEVLDMHREERTNAKGTVIIYTVLTVKYTIYAPDGSNITLTVMGEGMDTGDKGVNKAMSIAMKYAMFQLFFIPTEELKDPDAEVFTDIKPTARPVKAPETKATVSVVNKVPNIETTPKPVENPVIQFLLTAKAGLAQKRGMDAAANHRLFKAQQTALVNAKLAPDKPADEYTMEEAENLIKAMEKCFDLTGTELKTE